MPVDGLEVAHTGDYQDKQIDWDDGTTSQNDNALSTKITDRFRVSTPLPAVITATVATGTLSGGGGNPTGSTSITIVGARMPYEQPLFT